MSAARTQRLDALDAQRGLIMAFMAIDHASLFVAGEHHFEYWGVALPDYGDALSMFTRVISHLCAPGFFFLMGVGMHFFHASRRARAMPEAAIRRHFIVRGLLLIAVDIFIVTPTWILGTLDKILAGEMSASEVPGAGGDLTLMTGVLTALGAAMVIAAFFVRMSGTAALGLACVLTLFCQAIVPDASRVGESLGVLARSLLIPGQEGALVIAYPILPWFAVCLFGIAYGHAVRRQPDVTLRASWLGGAVAMVLFVLIRGAEGFGTHHPVPGEGLVAFLTVTKYPPSIAYLLLSLGMNALFLALIMAARGLLEGPARALLVFGRAPLFFYVVHLYLFAFLGQMLPGDTTLLGMYPVWLVGLAALYPMCRWYDGFKRKHSEDSIWRMF
ncbi:MAG: DUF1624 domain-containing protein [bacterium]|nr:DUF1624 domain-containing protein [bacterium]